MVTTVVSKQATPDPQSVPPSLAPVRVAVSTVIFALRPSDQGRVVWLPLVRRTRHPHLGQWALPGGWVGPDEALSDAAARTLADTTGLRPNYLEQLYTFGRPDRSPGARVISIVYFALVRGPEETDQDDEDVPADTGNVRWFRAEGLEDLAFDHNEIVEYSLWRLRNKVEYAQVAFHLIGETFALSELREVYEAILGRRLDPANFRRQIEATGTIIPTEERLRGGRHRPARLYRCQVNVDPRAAGPRT